MPRDAPVTKCNAHASFLPTITQLTLPVQPVASAAAVRHSPDDYSAAGLCQRQSGGGRAGVAGAGLHLLCGEQTVDGGQARVLQGPCQPVRSTCSCAGSRAVAGRPMRPGIAENFGVDPAPRACAAAASSRSIVTQPSPTTWPGSGRCE